MTPRSLAPLLGLLLATGCAGDASLLNHVYTGMTRPQVIEVTGEPTTSAAHEDGAEFLYYHWNEEGRLGGKARYVVKLRDGAVVAFGRPEDVSAPPAYTRGGSSEEVEEFEEDEEF